MPSFDLKFPDAPVRLGPDSWASMQPGTIGWVNADRFGCSDAKVFLGMVDGETARFVDVNVCYDEENDVFLTTNATPDLPDDACKCYKGQGYSACNCVSRAIDPKAMVEWFRAHQSDTLRDDAYEAKIEEHHWWHETAPRDDCKRFFKPNGFDFSRLCHFSWCGC